MKREYGLGKVLKLTAWALTYACVQVGLLAGTVVTLEWLGNLPGRDNTMVWDVSADGSVVVGRSMFDAGVGNAIRWEDGSMTDLGRFAGTQWSEAWAVSADGSIIVGESRREDDRNPVIWQNGEMINMGELPGYSGNNWAKLISGDGSIVIGEAGDQIYRWKAGEKERLTPPMHEGTPQWWTINDISYDGSIMVGSAGYPGEIFKGFRLENSVYTFIDNLPNTDGSFAEAVSANGSVIIGSGLINTSTQVVIRWENGMIHELEAPPNVEWIGGTDVSADGAFIIGESSLGSILWEADNNWEPVLIESILENNGFSNIKAGVTAISDDGSTIIGHGSNNGSFEPFRIRIVEDTPAWAGYPIISEAGDVDTTPWLGWINVTAAPWVYSYGITGWMYCPEENVTETGGWVYLTK